MTRRPEAQDFVNPLQEGRRLFAEAWGTFLLVLLAAGGDVAAVSGGAVSPSMIGVAFEWILRGKATASGTVAAQGSLARDEEAAASPCLPRLRGPSSTTRFRLVRNRRSPRGGTAGVPAPRDASIDQDTNKSSRRVAAPCSEPAPDEEDMRHANEEDPAPT